MLREPSIALAIVCGPGGSGKTVSVVKALHDYINEKERLAGALMPGDFPTRSTLPELVASWRSTYPRAPESLTQSLTRIRIANRAAERPILLKALPMIVVMPNGRASNEPVADPRVPRVEMQAHAAFEKELIADLIPFIESHYSADRSRERRALAGLSLGDGSR